MPRNFNQSLRDDLLDIIKRKWFINGQQIFSCPLHVLATEAQELALARGEQRKARGEQIMHYINALESGGWIKVYRGEGNQPNRYEFVDDNVMQNISEAKEQLNEQLEDFVDKMNGNLRDIVNFELNRIKDVEEKIGEVHYYKNALRELQIIGYGVDGSITLKAPQNSSLPIILEQLSKSAKQETEQENNQ